MSDLPTYHKGKRNFGTGYDMMNRIEVLEAKLAKAAEALRVAMDGLNGLVDSNDAFDIARAAIAKAKGEAQ
jgi:hypothetical protein